MDASAASPEVQTDYNVCSFLLQIQNSSYPTTMRSNNTVIKYTKLPEFDFDSKVLWPQKNSYVLQPRLRRIVALNDQDNIMRTSRSLRSELGGPLKLMSSTYAKRKIVTISEDEEGDLLPAYSKSDERKLELKNRSHRAVGSDVRIESTRSRPSSASSKYSKKQEVKPSAKPIALNNTSKTLNSSKTFCKSKNTSSNFSTNSAVHVQENKSRILQERDNTRPNRNISVRNRTSLSKNMAQPSVSDKAICLIKNKLLEPKKYSVAKPCGDPNKQYDRVSNSTKELKKRNKSPVIHVPYDKGQNQEVIATEITHISLQPVAFVNNELKKIDGTSSMERNVHAKDMNVGTDPEPEKVDVITEIEIEEIQKTDNNIQTDIFQNSWYDNLEIPNVTLTKDKSDLSKDGNGLGSQSLPNLQVPSLKITPRKDDNLNARNLSQKASYIIGRATVTYMTRQKIDFHVVDSSEKPNSNSSSRSLSYPMSVVSALKKEHNKLQNEAEMQKKKDRAKSEVDCGNEVYSPNVFDSTKLVKPSEIISTIRVNSGLLKSDYICEQFQRELDFIDSFFESLQYLESCSLSDKGFASKKVETWVSKSGFDIKNPEYDLLFSNLENGTNVDDTETMASKSLCLLNLLIRDEQRRAKNLLFVLKMREDALKDFTKSQILWLENKKKQDNIDIPTLKKKQRGALLKLQHECGEMQRMRKALLTLSEKRKVALMKAKKNIELKLKNNVTVNHMLLGKKKLKRNSSGDRSSAPLKCFDLSSSGCEESTTSRPKSDTALLVPEWLPIETNVKSVEKSIQTGDSLIGSALVDQATDTATENYITVDGGYLNILFSNLSLPEIFSNGKHYEVNEEALKTTLNSANNRNSVENEINIVDKFIFQIKNREQDRSSTPSTARSLVEEFDQYYKGFAEEEKSPVLTPECGDKDKEIVDLLTISKTNTDICERNSINTGTFTTEISVSEVQKSDDMYVNDNDTVDVNENAMNSVNTQVLKGKDSITIATQAGPLPVPAGAAATFEPPAIPAQATSPLSASSSSVSDESVVSVSSLSSQAAPAQSEAEELRRQQLAIEREIKALEQQQCQLLVVREIPDKPPPPYTPPTESRALKLPRMFLADETIEEKVHRNLSDSITVSIEPTDAFDIFLQDFCEESAVKYKAEQSDKPWDACNLLPHKAPLDSEQLVHRTAADVRDVLTCVPPTTVSGVGVGARRSDHIDDILFSEWRRCEPEWTALHADEAHVKTQIFEGIFQKILTETIDQYKKTVLTPNEN